MSKRVVSTKLPAQAKGFTLIELIFAMAAFSTMLIIAVSGLLNAMYIYNQANVSRNNQQETRTRLDEIGREIRSSTSALVATSGLNNSLCLIGTPDGNVYYDVDGNKHLRRRIATSPSDCSALSGSITTLTSSGVVVEGSLSGSPGFVLQSITQTAVAPITSGAQSIRITLGIKRGTGVSLRQKQFSNQFELTSTYLVQGVNGS